MKLSASSRILVGLATFLLLVPACMINGFFLFLMTANEAALQSFFSKNFDNIWDFGMSIITGPFSLGSILVCSIILLYFGLFAFYLTHIIRNDEAVSWIRAVFAITLFIFPILAMPFYYLIFLFGKSPPDWALDRRTIGKPLIRERS